MAIAVKFDGDGHHDTVVEVITTDGDHLTMSRLISGPLISSKFMNNIDTYIFPPRDKIAVGEVCRVNVEYVDEVQHIIIDRGGVRVITGAEIDITILFGVDDYLCSVSIAQSDAIVDHYIDPEVTSDDVECVVQSAGRYKFATFGSEQAQIDMMLADDRVQEVILKRESVYIETRTGGGK